jgi:voltage-gated potassium channel
LQLFKRRSLILTLTKQDVRTLYYGTTRGARVFRFALLLFDTASVVFFVGTSMTQSTTWIYLVDALIAIVIVADLAARFWIAKQPLRMFKQFTTWTDLIVIVTLILPTMFDSFLFLRVLRALRVLRSYRVLADLRTESAFFRRNEEVIQSVINLVVFVFVMTAVVYVLEVHHNSKINNYVDALYFTITALTTTGFGDITLEGASGRLLSIFILLVGVALFLRLVQTIFRPPHVTYECPDCGLTRHDMDAVHCKHCGRTLHIVTEGEGD